MSAKHRAVTAFQRRILNPLMKPLAGYVRGWILLETKGRKSGMRRRVPVGCVREGDVLWIVSEHGRRAGYVNNIAADPKVRVRVGGRWREGRATIRRDLDPDPYLRRQNFLNSAPHRLVSTDPVVVEIRLGAD